MKAEKGRDDGGREKADGKWQANGRQMAGKWQRGYACTGWGAGWANGRRYRRREVQQTGTVDGTDGVGGGVAGFTTGLLRPL